MVGSASEYPAAEVGKGSYFVVVQASAANNAMTIACGNLAAPNL